MINFYLNILKLNVLPDEVKLSMFLDAVKLYMILDVCSKVKYTPRCQS